MRSAISTFVNSSIRTPPPTSTSTPPPTSPPTSPQTFLKTSQKKLFEIGTISLEILKCCGPDDVAKFHNINRSSNTLVIQFVKDYINSLDKNGERSIIDRTALLNCCQLATLNQLKELVKKLIEPNVFLVKKSMMPSPDVIARIDTLFLNF